MNDDSRPLARPRVAFLLLLALCLSVLFFWVIRGFVLAVFLAAVLAGLLSPLRERLTKSFGGRRTLAVGVTVALSVVLVIIPFLIFSAVLVGEATRVAGNAEAWLGDRESLAAVAEEAEKIPALEKLLPYQDRIVEKANELVARAGGWVAANLVAGVKGTAAFFLSLFVLLYSLFYFLTEGRGLLDGVLRRTPLTAEDRSRLLGTFVSVTRATLKGKLIIGLVQGGLAGLALWLAGIQGVFFWTAVMVVLSVIPAVGTAVVWVPAVIYLALTGQTGAAIGVGLWCLLVVGTIDNLLSPRLIGKDIEMPDLMVLLTTLGGLATFGPAGIVIGPIIGALYIALWQLWGGAVDETRTDEPAAQK